MTARLPVAVSLSLLSAALQAAPTVRVGSDSGSPGGVTYMPIEIVPDVPVVGLQVSVRAQGLAPIVPKTGLVQPDAEAFSGRATAASEATVVYLSRAAAPMLEGTAFEAGFRIPDGFALGDLAITLENVVLVAPDGSRITAGTLADGVLNVRPPPAVSATIFRDGFESGPSR